jgi:hypothetical protein
MSAHQRFALAAASGLLVLAAFPLTALGTSTTGGFRGATVLAHPDPNNCGPCAYGPFSAVVLGTPRTGTLYTVSYPLQGKGCFSGPISFVFDFGLDSGPPNSDLWSGPAWSGDTLFASGNGKFCGQSFASIGSGTFTGSASISGGAGAYSGASGSFTFSGSLSAVVDLSWGGSLRLGP